MARKCLMLTLPIAVFTLAMALVQARFENAHVELAAVSNVDSKTDIDTRRFPDIEIIGATYGCPQGTGSVFILGNILNILFDQYQAQTRHGTDHAYRSCNVMVYLRIPPGYRIALLEIDYHGYADIPYGGHGRLRAEYFFAGGTGSLYVRHFPPGFQGNYMVTDFVGGDTWSPCGGTAIARANTDLLAEKRSPDYIPEATVSLTDIMFYFDSRRC